MVDDVRQGRKVIFTPTGFDPPSGKFDQFFFSLNVGRPMSQQRLHHRPKTCPNRVRSAWTTIPNRNCKIATVKRLLAPKTRTEHRQHQHQPNHHWHQQMLARSTPNRRRRYPNHHPDKLCSTNSAISGYRLPKNRRNQYPCPDPVPAEASREADAVTATVIPGLVRRNDDPDRGGVPVAAVHARTEAEVATPGADPDLFRGPDLVREALCVSVFI